jgi:hypothetical protein
MAVSVDWMMVHGREIAEADSACKVGWDLTLSIGRIGKISQGILAPTEFHLM